MALTFSELKLLIHEYEFQFKKKFGQNFIMDENIIQSILKYGKIDKSTFVLEIGPGAGSLTVGLAKQAKKVVCYEIDSDLTYFLDRVLKEYQNVEVYYEDFLKASFVLPTIYTNHCVVANLPYYITTPILMKLMLLPNHFQKMIIMVQKEVGNRLKAEVGTKEYGAFSVILQYFYVVRKCFDVSKNVFYPKPKVDSIVVELTLKKKQEIVLDLELFMKLVKQAFQFKRKTLCNNLKEYPLDAILPLLHKYGVDQSVRAEQLPVSFFVELANLYCKNVS